MKSNDEEVAIVYYRAGYAPSHFKSNNEWDALTKIELSKAIKTPDVATFLTGMKKTQEYLYLEEACLKELCNNDPLLVAKMRSVFAKFYKLETEVMI